MQIFIQTDHNISLTDARRAGIEQELTKAVDRFDARLTRIEAHLSDLNSDRGGASDKRCMLEARPSGLKPLAVDHTAATMELAISNWSARWRARLGVLIACAARAEASLKTSSTPVHPNPNDCPGWGRCDLVTSRLRQPLRLHALLYSRPVPAA